MMEISICLSKSDRGCRSSRSEVFCKKGVLRNFTKFTGKHLCQSFFFNRVAGLIFKIDNKDTRTAPLASDK